MIEIRSWEAVCFYCGYSFDFKLREEIKGAYTLKIPDKCPQCGKGIREDAERTS